MLSGSPSVASWGSCRVSSANSPYVRLDHKRKKETLVDAA